MNAEMEVEIALLEDLLKRLRAKKEDAGRSELARRLAISVTELEKVYAYLCVYVAGSGE